MNTATAKDLEMRPGVGTQTAARIIEYREPSPSGDTGRTRVLRFDNRSRRWMPL
jgi:hypothetical protein